MSQDNIISFKNPASEVQDLLTEIARQGAREMLAKAIELEVQDFLETLRTSQQKMGANVLFATDIYQNVRSKRALARFLFKSLACEIGILLALK